MDLFERKACHVEFIILLYSIITALLINQQVYGTGTWMLQQPRSRSTAAVALATANPKTLVLMAAQTHTAASSPTRPSSTVQHSFSCHGQLTPRVMRLSSTEAQAVSGGQLSGQGGGVRVALETAKQRRLTARKTAKKAEDAAILISN